MGRSAISWEGSLMDVPDPHPAIFANAMWRTGSTYLASRFACSDKYLLFYEPCHEGVGNPGRGIRPVERRLNHPDLGGSGYFDSYNLSDPFTGKRLTDLFDFSICLRDVYRDASPGAVRFLAACIRIARQQGKTAFLGFCRSGTQHRLAHQLLGGTPIHLWRAPREQWHSYNWPENDYFLPGTLLQLLLSERYRALALSLVGEPIFGPALKAIDYLPDRHARTRYRIARRIASGLPLATCYALFYLSWRICRDSQRANADYSFSLSELADDSALQHELSGRFGVDFSDLRPTPPEYARNIPHEEIEMEVDRLLTAASDGISMRPNDYLPASLSAAR